MIAAREEQGSDSEGMEPPMLPWLRLLEILLLVVVVMGPEARERCRRSTTEDS